MKSGGNKVPDAKLEWKISSKNFKLKMSIWLRLAFIDYLYSGCRKDSNEQSAVHPIVLWPQRSKINFGPNTFL
jgi:hypothetical protein